MLKPSLYHPTDWHNARCFLSKLISAMKTTRSSAPSDDSRSGSPGTILETITHKIDESLTPMRTAASQLFRAEFDMDWDLTNFLRRQEYDATWETAVGLAITLTGSNGNAQALTCMDYMCQTWPLSGCVVVRLLQKALVSPGLSCSGKQALRNYCQISHHSRFPCRWNGSRH